MTPTTVAGRRLGTVVARSVVPCSVCREPHPCVVITEADDERFVREVVSWAAPDGHSYRHMTAEQAMEWARADALRDAAAAVEGLRMACHVCHDPMAWHLTDAHPSGLIAGQWCYCERKPAEAIRALGERP